MADTALGFARRLARWGVQAAIVGLTACGGGGAGDPSLSTGPNALRQPTSACMAAPGFTAQDPFVVNSLGAGSQQQVRFAGPLDTGGFAVAWLSRTPADTLPSWRLQWQRFDASGNPVGGPSDLPYAEDVAPLNVAVLIQPSGRIVVEFIVSRVVDPADPFVFENAVLLRMFQDGTPLPGEIKVASQVFNALSRPATFTMPMLAGFADGSFLATWRLTGRVAPELWVQKIAADGTLLGDLVRIDALGGSGPPRTQLLTLPEGGWIAATPFRTAAPGLQDYTLVTQVGVRHALDTADVLGVAGALPGGSVLLRVARGLVVATGPSQPGGDVALQPINNGGHAAGPPALLSLTPYDAVTLSAGEAALLASAGGTITLQRVGTRGDPIGLPLPTSVPIDAVAGAAPGGALVLVWALNEASGSQVLAQLFTPTCPG